MKKMLMLCSCAIVLVFGAGPALAQPNYQFAEAGTKNFISETTIAPGDPISLDLYLADAGAPQNAGGVWVDFQGSTASISYVSGGRCLAGGAEGCTGPWQDNAGILVNEPLGAGTVLYQVANLDGAAPDVDGDLIVGTLTLECSAPGDATVDLTVIPGVPTWTPINDADVVAGSVLIHQIQTCSIDADCDDGEFCNGDETCAGGVCQAGTDPCAPQLCDEGTETCADCFIDADCDDGEFCNGDEICVGGVCQAGSDPCPDDSLFCTGVEGCGEINDICTQSGDPCAPQFCDEGTGTCIDCFIDADCDDGVFCDGDETCVGGVCQAGTDPCARQLCDEGTETCADCFIDADCDDGIGCTDDTCDAGWCVYTPNDANCPGDGVFCNGIEFCDAVNDCSSPGDPCEPDNCNEGSGTCAPCLDDADCDDSIGCTDDTCDAGRCVYTPNDANCPEDGVFCNGIEFCDVVNDCSSPGDPCEPVNCNEGSVTCGPCLDVADCDDGLYCTGDETCDAGTCVSSGDPCPDDGLYCDGDEICTEGAGSFSCESTGNPCPPDRAACSEGDEGPVCSLTTPPECTEDGDCNDENDCTDDTCESGSCNNTTVTDGTTCDDGEFCTATDTCQAGCCEGTGSPCAASTTCNEETQTCDCTDDGYCDDGVFCNGSETCDPQAGCRPGSNPCTDDGAFCNGVESCDEGADQCVSSGDPCTDDGAFCNGVESCDEGADQCVSSGDPCAADEICIPESETCEPVEPEPSIYATFTGCGTRFSFRFGSIQIQGTGTDFTALSIVQYDSPLVIKLPKLLSRRNNTITQFVFLWPGDFLFPEWNYPATVRVTVNELSDTIDIPTCREETGGNQQ